MPKAMLSAFENRPLLDIRSLGRQGPGRRDRISPAEVEIIRRTLNRDPEVMVKVISIGGKDLKSIAKHIDYIGRKGEVGLTTDDGQEIKDRDEMKDLLNDWNLDLEESRSSLALRPTDKRKAPKLVHKLMFSMPPGTPPNKVLAAVKNFAREEFGLQHRYAMALHTDEPHPHVHVLVKAMSEQGVRLNIRKATLRMWRSEFAKYLREQGVGANATDRLARGQFGRTMPDGKYRVDARNALTRAPRESSDYLSKVTHRKGGMEHVLNEVRSGWHRLSLVFVRMFERQQANEGRGGAEIAQ